MSDLTTLSASAVRPRVLLAFVALGVIWGSNFIMKWAAETISPRQITLRRVLFGLPVLLRLRRGRFRLPLVPPAH